MRIMVHRAIIRLHVLTTVALLLVLLFAGSSLAIEVQCGTVDGGYPTASPCTIGHADINVVFFTYSDVLGWPNATDALPSDADQVLSDMSSYLERMSMGAHTASFNIVRRPGTNSGKQWVYPGSRQDDVCSQIWPWLDSQLPEGWETTPSLVIFIPSVLPAGVSNPYGQADGLCHGPSTNQFCNTFPVVGYAWVPYGYRTFSGQDPTWYPYPAELFRLILTHEYGHTLGLWHVPADYAGLQGEGGCGAEYYQCYDPMDDSASDNECANMASINGFIPFSAVNMHHLGWWTPTIVSSTTTNIILHDVRTTGELLQIPLCSDEGFEDREYLLLANYQQTQEDVILGGRGLLVWHVRGKSGVYCPWDFASYDQVWDVESPTGKFARDVGSYCATWPKAADAAVGSDTLDCKPGMLASALWAGVSLQLSGQSMSEATNPSTHRYAREYLSQIPVHRNFQQTWPSGVAISGIRAEPDPSRPGKYQVRLNVTISNQPGGCY
ncbi:MAG: hypothetical protein IT349_21030 [Candidatus Eisenbacteria bacterium]|nr:hypothetical protein [Candidatus Eisenbacteria bacterium]